MIKFVLVCIVLSLNLFCSAEDELKAVVVIFRHGDRTPVHPYPKDPYKNSSFWPVGFGQLTNAGKLRHLELGRWLRQRYGNYLPILYSEKDITVRSTDVDRTLMSAEANLAGLYPPVGKQIFDRNLTWQPIPIHTVPEKEDAVLAMKKKCPKYSLLYKQLFKTDYFENIRRKNHDLYAYLTVNSGDTVTTLETLEYLYNTLLIETFFNYTLPQWAQKVFLKMQPFAFLSFATACYTTDLARYKAGPLFNEIIGYFLNRTSNKPDTKKLLVYSAHDTTIANVLNTMGAFQYHSPPYASTILFEVRERNNKTYINTFYKNSSIPQNIILKGCEFNCDLDEFIKLLSPITLNLQQWEEECQISWIYYWPLGFTGNIILISLVGCISLGIIGIFISLKMAEKSHESSYIQLPNEEYA